MRTTVDGGVTVSELERLISQEDLRAAQRFHGNVCVPLAVGLKMSYVAMQELGVSRAADREISAVVEVGDHHWASCLLDGVQWATGCTLGKENLRIEPLGKFAMTLIEASSRRAVRISWRPEFIEQALQWPLVVAKREGRSDYRPAAGEVAALIEDVLGGDAREQLTVRRMEGYALAKAKMAFDGFRCSGCGEFVMAPFAREIDGQMYCLACYKHALHQGL